MTCTVGAVADWTAGYEAGYRAGYRAALAVLDDAAAALAALRPSRAVDTVHARRAQTQTGRRPGEPDHNDPADLAAYRARIHASWGLTPPDVRDCPRSPVRHRPGSSPVVRLHDNAFDAYASTKPSTQHSIREEATRDTPAERTKP